MLTFDIHAHCVPDAFLTVLADSGGRLGATFAHVDGKSRIAVGTGPMTALPHGIVDVDDRIAVMDRTGVDVQVLSPWMKLSACEMPAEVAAPFARLHNQALAAVAAGHPDRFLALSNLPMGDPRAAAAELTHCVTELGMVGAEIATRPAGRDLDDPIFDPFWHAATELKAVVLVHPLHSLAGRGVERHFLNNLVGNPAESTVAIGHLIFGGVLDRHPGLRICLVHGGGFAPYQIGRWDVAFRDNVRGAAASLTTAPSELLRRLYFDSVLHSPAAMGYLVATVGADRVVMGSDFPFEMGEPNPVAAVRRAEGINAVQTEKILSLNARTLLADRLKLLHGGGTQQ